MIVIYLPRSLEESLQWNLSVSLTYLLKRLRKPSEEYFLNLSLGSFHAMWEKPGAGWHVGF